MTPYSIRKRRTPDVHPWVAQQHCSPEQGGTVIHSARTWREVMEWLCGADPRPPLPVGSGAGSGGTTPHRCGYDDCAGAW